MRPRLRLSSGRVSQSFRGQRPRCQHEIVIAARSVSSAAAAASGTPAPSIDQMTSPRLSIARYPPSQPPSHRNPEYRRSQLLRQYTSIIRTSPLIVFFQHDNLRSVEWTAIRRELGNALQKVDDQMAAQGRNISPLAPLIKLQIIQTSIFEVALRIVEHFRPEKAKSSGELPGASGLRDDPSLTHDLSRTAHDAVRHMKGKHELTPVLVGPVAIISIPHVSPEHMKAALSILAPQESGFAAPRRKANPTYYELDVQNGLQKLSILAARVDGKVFDLDQTKWIGSIEGGMDGLRSQLVMALQSMGASITNALEDAGKSLYLTLESRRSVLEEEQKGGPESKNES